MGMGRAKGADKASLAALAAISSPLLETSIAGATGVLVSITMSQDVQLDEIDLASQMIAEEAHPDAQIIWGAAFDPTFEDEMCVTIIATGFNSMGNGTTEVRHDVAADKTPEEAPCCPHQVQKADLPRNKKNRPRWQHG